MIGFGNTPKRLNIGLKSQPKMAEKHCGDVSVNWADPKFDHKIYEWPLNTFGKVSIVMIKHLENEPKREFGPFFIF